VVSDARSAAALSDALAQPAPARIGETFGRRVRLAEHDIRAFAASVDDWNPLHHDVASAQAAGYPGLIASGTQVGSLLMALTATHFTRPDLDGRARAGLGLGFELRFRAPVIADEDIELHWTVTAVEPKSRLDGWIARMTGEARSRRGLLTSASGTLLLRRPAEGGTR
jgi:acyl dehydratase